MDFKIGIIADSFRVGPWDGIRRAADLGADGVQVYAVHGDVSGDMPLSRRDELVALVESLGIRISALCGDTGRGFANAEANPETLRVSKKIVDLAVDLGTNVVTTHIGKVPEDTANPIYGVMLDACRELADYAASKGVTFAVETGPEKSAVLRGFLDRIDSTGLGVNLDPANLWMCSLDDPAAAVGNLARYIVHTHAKDGIPLNPPENGARWRELPLGEGGVRWPEYLKALDSIGYHGFLTIERECGDDPAKDIAMAVSFLRGQIG